jgi:hypothetical protein
MRCKLFTALGAIALGLAFSQPAAAGGWHDSYGTSYGYGTGNVYIHHHVYLPPRYRHVYHVHRPGTAHVHVVHAPRAGCCGTWGHAHPYRHFRWRWHGQGHGCCW